MKLQLNKHNRKGFTLIELMVVIAILAALAAVGYGPIMDHMGDGDRQACKSNMDNICTALNEFQSKKGKYPSDETVNKIDKSDQTRYGVLQGTSSNCYLRQLFAAGFVKDEKIFHAKYGTFEEGDGSIAKGKCLEPGENAFAYVVKKASDRNKKASGRNKKTDVNYTSVTESNAPLLFSCVVPSDTPYDGDETLFNMTDFRKHAFMLKADKSVTDLKDKPGYEDASGDELRVAKSVFPENRDGDSTGNDYAVLCPEQK